MRAAPPAEPRPPARRPGARRLPRRGLAARGARRAASAEPRSFDYGDPQGTPAAPPLATYLGRARGVSADPGRVVGDRGRHPGALAGARVVAARGGRTMAMEDPCHGPHRDAVRDAGLEVLPLPVDRHGAASTSSPAGAGRGLRDAGAPVPARRHALPERRQQLVAWAREHGRAGDRGRLRRRAALRPAAGGRAPGHGAGPRGVRRHRVEDPRPRRPPGLGGAARRLGRRGDPRPGRRHPGPGRHQPADVRVLPRLLRLRPAGALPARDVPPPGRRARWPRWRRRPVRHVRHRGRRPPPGLPAGPAGVEQEVVDEAAERGLALLGLDSQRHGPSAYPPAIVLGYTRPSAFAWPPLLSRFVELLRDVVH